MSKTTLIIYTLILTILLVTCKRNNSAKNEVFVYELSFGQSFMRGSYSVMKYMKMMDSKEYEIYNDTIGSDFFFFSIHLLNRKTLLEANNIYKFVDSKKYLVKNREIDIWRFYHEEKDSDDIESYVYYSPDIGLIAYCDCSIYRLDYIVYNETVEIKEKILNDIAESLTDEENNTQ